MKWFRRMPIWILAICAFLVFCGFNENEQKVYDNANLFTNEEEERLQELCVAMAKQEKLDVIIYTTNTSNGMSIDDYAEVVYRGYGFGYDAKNGAGIMLLIDMGSRKLCVYESQLEENSFLFLDAEKDVMIDEVAPYLTDGDYFDGAKRFINLIPEYDDAENVSDKHAYDGSGSVEYDVDGKRIFNADSIVVRVLGSSVVAGIAVAIMHFNQRSKKVTDGRIYLRDNRFDIRERSDIFTHTTVTKHRIETDSGSGGGGGGGHSGGSHSGGGSHSSSRSGSF